MAEMANPFNKVKFTDCVKAFILAILCGNPILRGTFVTLLNSLILTFKIQIDVLILFIGHLNIINQLLSLALVNADSISNKISTGLNQFSGIFAQFSDCNPIKKLTDMAGSWGGIGKSVYDRSRRLAGEANRVTNLTRIQEAKKQELEDVVEFMEEFVENIADLCVQ